MSLDANEQAHSVTSGRVTSARSLRGSAMIERHYGNDVPTGPIPVVPPLDDTDVPAEGRSASIPAQRSAPEGEERPDLPTSERRRWPWVLLAVLVVLCVLAAVVIGLFGVPAF